MKNNNLLKKQKINTVCSVIQYVSIIIAGLVLPREILSHYGSEMNGLVHSIKGGERIMSEIYDKIEIVVEAHGRIFAIGPRIHDGCNLGAVYRSQFVFDELALPDHGGLTVSVHDSCSYRHKPQVHAAVRSLLRKMNIEIIETAFSGTRSVCCGDNFYGYVPNEQVEARMKERADQFPCENVAVTCIGCVHAMTIGGKRPLYMPDLILGRLSDPATDTLDEYHGRVAAYREEH